MLDDELKALSELDNLRIRAQELADEGMRSLASIENNAPPDGPDAKLWQASGWKIETAMLVRAQNKAHPGGAKEKLVKRLERISLYDDLLTTRDPELPVLLAARAMQSLIALPSHTLSKATLLCYYRIIREIYVADSPDWNAGGARAGAGGEVTAYVTSECVRAVLMLERSIRKTAEFFRRTAEFYARILRLESAGIPLEWKDVESERAALEWFISMNNRWSHLAVRLSLAEPDGEKEPFRHVGLKKYFPKLGEELHTAFKGAVRDFKEAQKEILAARRREKRKKSPTKNRYMRSESAHLLALGVIQEAVAQAEKASSLCSSSDTTLKSLNELADLFHDIADRVRRILEPAKRYIASVLDHELTAATSQERPLWDARELVFAAGAYGALTGWSKDEQHRDGRHVDERLVRACELLVKELSEGGFFPRGRPYHSVKEGLRWHTLQFQVCRAFSELLKNVEYPVDPVLVKRMLFPFEDLLTEAVDPVSGRKVRGWHMEDPPIPRRPTMWVSMLACMALDKLVRMLDKRINQMVLSHFSVKQPQQITLTLDKLIYPDYGRRLFDQPDQSEAPNSEEAASNEPVGITLQRMRAHIVGATLGGKYSTEFSAVLHGPPGTGKTTLLEALAKSSHVPLVEMSPSDIAVFGQERMEARARTIFQALSMLTRVVIIFDEFEPVLWRRADGGEQQRLDLQTFLTPGMLPKLTRLYSAAKSKKVAYALVTNQREKLDKAAIRRGRFDHHVGIYMPDPVSRAGRLMLECLACKQENDGIEDGPEGGLDEEAGRFREVVIATGGLSPARLGPRWIRNPDKKASLPPAVSYILGGPERKPNPATIPEAGDDEYEQQLHAWERALRDKPEDFHALMEKPARQG